MKNKTISLLLFYSSIGFTLLFLGACNEEQTWHQGVPEVPIAVVEQGNVIISKEYSASIEGVSNVEIRPQVSGYLSKIFVDEGEYVTIGQPLFKIEDRVFQEQLSNGKAFLTSAQARLTTAAIELERKKELVKTKIVSDLQLQEAEAAYKAAEGAVGQAQSAIESTKINLDYTTIKAPVNGYIGRFDHRLGSLLSSSDPKAITVLSDISQVHVYFSMSENDFVLFQQKHEGNSVKEKLADAAPVSLLLSNGSKYELPGRIDAIDGQFNKTTGSITLRAKFDNPKTLLRTGNTGRIVMEQKKDNAILFPIASTTSMQDRIFIYSVDEENKVAQLPIQISGKVGENFIVADGVKPGVRYIVAGFERLQTGNVVTEQKSESTESQTSHN